MAESASGELPKMRLDNRTVQMVLRVYNDDGGKLSDQFRREQVHSFLTAHRVAVLVETVWARSSSRQVRPAVISSMLRQRYESLARIYSFCRERGVPLTLYVWYHVKRGEGKRPWLSMMHSDFALDKFQTWLKSQGRKYRLPSQQLQHIEQIELEPSRDASSDVWEALENDALYLKWCQQVYPGQRDLDAVILLERASVSGFTLLTRKTFRSAWKRRRLDEETLKKMTGAFELIGRCNIPVEDLKNEFKRLLC